MKNMWKQNPKNEKQHVYLKRKEYVNHGLKTSTISDKLNETYNIKIKENIYKK